MSGEDRKTQTRGRILASARDLVKVDGAGALSMTAVADRAGVSRRTLHRHFRSRRDLARALVDSPTVPEVDGPVHARGFATSSADGRQRILTAAQDLFTAKGYSATSVREIAVRAAISQPMLYRYFPSKEKLFLEAAVAPLNTFIDSYIAREGLGLHHVDRSLHQEIRAICGHIHGLLSQNRELLHSLVTARHLSSGPTGPDVLEDLFAHSFDRMTRGLDELIRRRSLPDCNRALVIRLFFSMALSIALYPDWLLRDHDDEEAVLDQMAALLVHGIGGP